MITRRVTFKLYPTKLQQNTLHYWRKLHCLLYNAAVYNRKTQYQKFGHAVNYLEQQNCLPSFKEVWPEYKPLGSHALQSTLKRVDLAFNRFFKGLGGYPKFKASRRYSGWTYPCNAGWKVQTTGNNGYLELSNLGSIQMRGQARTWGTPTTCTMIFRHGKWYASITVNCTPERLTGNGAVGIDLGCKEAITFSTGEQISKPDFIQIGQQKVKSASKKLRRKRAPNRQKKIKPSRRWKKARARVSQLQRKVARQRENWLHQITSHIVSGNSLVAGEKLNVKGMTRKGKKRSADGEVSSPCRRTKQQKRQKAGLNRSMLDVAFGTISQMLEYKLAEAGGFYVESPTPTLKPTQRCAKCWELTPKTLADRVHICQHCGHIEDRDVNAAQVNLIWARGLERTSTGVESSSSTSCGSMRQLGAKKRHKLLAQRSS
ncbi:MAG: transposase [Cyanosarcina radialis HA8281-LM2]|jgi:putative transposase|nr:transposase [Cyanosarcina radialis HA8281-LM2]